MRLCNDVITVFNAAVDPETGGKTWRPTVIRGVHWYRKTTTTIDTGRGGLVAANECTIRIPLDALTSERDYMSPVAYGNACCAVAGTTWTLARGDVVVLGEVQGDSWTPSELQKAYGDDCAVILGVTDNRRAPNAPHWRVTAG